MLKRNEGIYKKNFERERKSRISGILIRNKKGLSTVVATVSIILLTIAAMAIVANVVVPMVENWLAGTDCAKYSDYFSFEKGEETYNCYQNQSGRIYYGITIEAKGADNETQSRVEGFILVLKKAGESESKEIKEGANVSLDDGGVRMLNSSLQNYILPKAGEIGTYVYNTTNTFGFAEVYTILKGGLRCEGGDSINLEREVCVGLPNLASIS